MRLVGLHMTPGPRLVSEIKKHWENGDVVTVLDHRLRTGALEALLRAVEPDHLVLDGDHVPRRRIAAHLESIQASEVAVEGVAAPVGGDSGRISCHLLDGDALVVLTGGTTGSPSQIVHTHESIGAAARLTSLRLEVDPSRDRWLGCLPPSHVGGLGVIVRSLVTGTPMDLIPRPDPGKIAAAPLAGATLTALVPTLVSRTDLSGYRRVLVGGASPLSPLPDNAVATWGMTETFGGIVYDGAPLDGVYVRSVDGELHVKTPTLGRCRQGGAQLAEPDGWFRTGDGGSVDRLGHVQVDGRIADVINTGGEKVWPATVEAALLAHPSVSECGVIGLDDPEWGSRVHAAIVPTESASVPTLEELRDFVSESLPRWCSPKSIEMIDCLPRTAAGKLDREELKRRADP